MSDVPTNSNLQVEVNKLATNLEKPSLIALSYSLRHPDTWPENFVWDYSSCDHCAVGLTLQLWYQHSDPCQGYDHDDNIKVFKTWIAKKMSIPYEVSERIFFNIQNDTVVYGTWRKKAYIQKTFDTVTPDQVADAIDKYLVSDRGLYHDA